MKYIEGPFLALREKFAIFGKKPPQTSAEAVQAAFTNLSLTEQTNALYVALNLGAINTSLDSVKRGTREYHKYAREKIRRGIHGNPGVAIAAADVMLTYVAELEETGRIHDMEPVTGGETKVIDELRIPYKPEDITDWQSKLVDRFKEKYETPGDYHWSKSALISLATQLLDMSVSPTER